MSRYFFEIAYDGSNYSGWQRQPNAITIQEVIESQLSKIIKSPVSIMGCGRTDAGVHASQFYFHADVDEIGDTDQLKFRFNQSIDNRISCQSIRQVALNAHARFDATSRSYAYHLHYRKDPFKRDYSTYYPTVRNLDFSILQEVADLLLKYDDFASFCKSRTDVKTTICHLKESRWEQDMETGTMTYFICADRFLRGMVRLIVGTSINVARGKLSIEELESAIQNKVKPPYAHSAPANGLFLTRVQYSFIER